jgi:cell wall-associated NlpC family hydrolase
MIRDTQDIIRRARSLVGSPFRPQGRDPQTGLDCVGLVLWVFQIEARPVRRDYRLSGEHLSELDKTLSNQFQRLPAAMKAAGDILLCRVRHGQAHLAIECGGSIIHADAKVRRVVERRGECAWPIIAAFRSTIQSS